MNEATRLGHMLSLTSLSKIYRNGQWLSLQKKSVAKPERRSRFSDP